MFTIWSREKGFGERFVHLFEAMERARALAADWPDIRFHVMQAHGWAMSTPSGAVMVVEGRAASFAA